MYTSQWNLAVPPSRRLLFQETDLALSETSGLGNQLPFSYALHHLFSRASPDMTSPHQVTWSFTGSRDSQKFHNQILFQNAHCTIITLIGEVSSVSTTLLVLSFFLTIHMTSPGHMILYRVTWQTPILWRFLLVFALFLTVHMTCPQLKGWTEKAYSDWMDKQTIERDRLAFIQWVFLSWAVCPSCPFLLCTVRIIFLPWSLL